MPVVASWDWENRLIYLAVADFDPIDIYREHRALRATDETSRQYLPMVKAIGGQPKGGGDRFGNALQTLDGAKIVPLDNSGINKVGGEVVTDNPDTDPDPYNTSTLTNPPRIQFAPIVVIANGGTGGGSITTQDKRDIIEGVWQEPYASYTISGTFGNLIQNLLNLLNINILWSRKASDNAEQTNQKLN